MGVANDEWLAKLRQDRKLAQDKWAAEGLDPALVEAAAGG